MRLKRWQKWLLIILGGIFILALFLFFARPLYLPDSFLIAQIEKHGSAALGMNLTIENGRFYLMRDASLSGITIQDSMSRQTITVDIVHVNYRILPLLQKNLVIDRLILIHPILRFSSSSPFQTEPTSRKTDIDSAIPTTLLASTEPEKIPFDFDLPLRVQIKQIDVQDLGVSWIKESQDAVIEIQQHGIGIQVKNLNVKSASELFASFQMQLEDTLRASLTSPDFSIISNSPISLKAYGIYHSDSSETCWKLSLTPIADVLSPLDTLQDYALPEIGLDGSAVLMNLHDLFIDSLVIKTEDMTKLVISAEISGIQHKPKIRLSVHEGRAYFDQWWAILDQLANLLDLESVFQGKSLGGILEITNASLEYSPSADVNSVHADVTYKIKSAHFCDNMSQLSIDGVDLNSHISGIAYPFNHAAFESQTDIEIDSMSVPGPNGQLQFIAPAKISFKVSTGAALKNATGNLSWDLIGPMEISQIGDLKFTANNFDVQNPRIPPDLSFRCEGSFVNLMLEKLSTGQLSGVLSGLYTLSFHDLGTADFTLNTAGSEITYQKDEIDIDVPTAEVSLRGTGFIDIEGSQVTAEEVILTFPPFGNVKSSASLHMDGSWSVSALQIDLDLEEILNLTRPLLPLQYRNLEFAGTVEMAGNGSGVIDSSGISALHHLTLYSKPLSLSLPSYQSDLDSVVIQASVDGDLLRMKSTGDLTVGRFRNSILRDEPFSDVTLTWNGFYSLKDKKGAGDVFINADELGVKLESDLQLQQRENSFDISSSLDFSFEAKDSTELISDLVLMGTAGAEFQVDIHQDSVFHLTGSLGCEDLEGRYSDQFSFDGLNMQLPVISSVEVDSSPEFVRDENFATSFTAEPILLTGLEHLYPPALSYGSVTCRTIRVDKYRLNNLAGIWRVEGGWFSIPRLSVEAYDGTIQGALSVYTRSFRPDSMNYWVKLNGMGLNTAKLPGAREKKGEDSEISAFAQVSGKGIEPNGQFSLQGNLDITHIGRGVADNILRFLDPNQSDPSIQTYRSYIRRGWGVKVFSFNIKDDFVYASITPSRPPLSKPDMFILSRLVGLGKSITFGRVPLRFFLTTPGFGNM